MDNKIKPKALLIIVICLVAVGTVILAGIVMKSQILGNMAKAFKESTTANSMFSFSAEAGDKIKIVFSSKIEEGTLDIYLYDSAGNIVHALDYAKELKEYITLNDKGEYTLVADYDDFVGKFKVAIYNTR